MISLVVFAVKRQAESTAAHAHTVASTDTGRHWLLALVNASSSSLLPSDLLAASLCDAGASRNKLTNDHVFLETDQMIGLRLDCRLGEHTRRLLEGGSREEAIGIKRCLGHTEQYGGSLGRLAAFCQHTSIGVSIDKTINQITWQHFCIAWIIHFHTTEHLTYNDLNVLVMDVHTRVTVDTLHLFDEVQMYCLT